MQPLATARFLSTRDPPLGSPSASAAPQQQITVPFVVFNLSLSYTRLTNQPIYRHSLVPGWGDGAATSRVSPEARSSILVLNNWEKLASLPRIFRSRAQHSAAVSETTMFEDSGYSSPPQINFNQKHVSNTAKFHKPWKVVLSNVVGRGNLSSRNNTNRPPWAYF